MRKASRSWAAPAQVFATCSEVAWDAGAEYLINAIRELHGHRHVKIVVYLPGSIDADTRAGITDAIRNYFLYREMAARFALRQMLRLGRTSLLVGLLFLAACTALWRFVFVGEDMSDRLLREGALILGWMAIWRPLEILLYDWWPLLRDIRLYRRIAAMPVEIRNA